MKLFLLILFMSQVLSARTCQKVIERKVQEATVIKGRIKAVEAQERRSSAKLDDLQHERYICKDPNNKAKLDTEIQNTKEAIAQIHRNKRKELQTLRGTLSGLPAVDQAYVIRQVRMERYVHIYPFLVQHYAKNELHTKNGGQMFMSEAAKTKQLVEELDEAGIPALTLKKRHVTNFEFEYRRALRKGSELDERIHMTKMDYVRGLNDARVIRERTERIAAQWRDEMLTWKDEQVCDYEVRGRIMGYKTKLREYLKQQRKQLAEIKEKRKALQLITLKKVKHRITALELLKTEMKLTPDQRNLVDRKIDQSRKIGRKFVPKDVMEKEKKEQIKEFELVKTLEQLSLKSNAFTGKICAEYLDVMNMPRGEFLRKMKELDYLERMISKQTKERMDRMIMLESKRNKHARKTVLAQAKLRNKMRTDAMKNLKEEVLGEEDAKNAMGDLFLKHVREHQHIPKELKVPKHPLDRFDYDRKFKI